ncbi:MAG: CMP-N-acetlyneuraminic acid synthetase [Polynucleobacter sp. 39-45-136]|jgi:CMP-N-acetylneuraminic acid synthetase|nr:MAG: CMP-N-acetlyneuraminic acid synthetase [Polynucleobacter sp. 39-45-136]
MIDGKSILAIIPARAGSKRLPRKNLIYLGDKPLIGWTIEAALGCSLIDEVIVSTDDREIADISIKYGAKVPFMRPVALASDEATSIDVIEHAVNFYDDVLGKSFDYVILLQPTSPLRNSQDIAESIDLLSIKNANAIISVCEAEHSPLWMNTLPSDQSMNGFLLNGVRNIRSQDLDKYYRLNGAIYICSIKKLMEQKTLFIDKEIYAYPMSIERSIDIDTYLDYLVAVAILQKSEPKPAES